MTILDVNGRPFEKQAQPLEPHFGSLLGGGRRNRVRATETVGHPGTAIYGGYVVENELDPKLTDRERYRTYSLALANCSVAAAGVRYFLNLCAKATWTFTPSDHPDGTRLAELTEEILTEDPDTSWARIIRRAAMYRFYGFSIQEWTAKRRADGLMTLADVAPRAQLTIERWDVDTTGRVLGVVQRNPQNQAETYIPRSKILYLVDDTLNDSPQGWGLFRHIVEPVRRLARYEQLEGFAFETDLRGIPVGRAPYAELRQAEFNGQISPEQSRGAVAPVEAFVRGMVKDPSRGVPGLILDSEVFTTTDEATRPSNQRKFDIELLQNQSSGLPDLARATARVTRDIARVLGVEVLLLGDNERGSHALAQDKTNQFSLTVDATLDELAQGFTRDLLRTIWHLNGWPEEAMPEMSPEAIAYRDVEQVGQVLSDMARAGAPLDPDDPAINEVRALMGLSPVEFATMGMDSALTPQDEAPELAGEDEV